MEECSQVKTLWYVSEWMCGSTRLCLYIVPVLTIIRNRRCSWHSLTSYQDDMLRSGWHCFCTCCYKLAVLTVTMKWRWWLKQRFIQTAKYTGNLLQSTRVRVRLTSSSFRLTNNFVQWSSARGRMTVYRYFNTTNKRTVTKQCNVAITFHYCSCVITCEM